MKIFHELGGWRKFRGSLIGASLGFVPTMGTLHEGHLSLIRRSVAENDLTAVSVFVNAPQFNDASDLAAYPRQLEEDARLADEAGADIVLAPDAEAMYPDQYRYRVGETEFSTKMEGSHRPGHFDGVLTVVLKLLNLVEPTRSYFGEKDYQQYLLIRGMAEAFFLRTEIIPCRTVRAEDGLALSSRNLRLGSDARKKAPGFHRALSSNKGPLEVEEELQFLGFDVEYVEDAGGRRFGAVILNGIRLIDNVELCEGLTQK